MKKIKKENSSQPRLTPARATTTQLCHRRDTSSLYPITMTSSIYEIRVAATQHVTLVYLFGYL
jgi:hypothetical protein